MDILHLPPDEEIKKNRPACGLSSSGEPSLREARRRYAASDGRGDVGSLLFWFEEEPSRETVLSGKSRESFSFFGTKAPQPREENGDTELQGWKSSGSTANDTRPVTHCYSSLSSEAIQTKSSMSVRRSEPPPVARGGGASSGVEK